MLATPLLAFPLALAILAAPAPVSPQNASKILSLRNLGLAQLEEGKPAEARKSFAKLAELTPDEPLPWANGAIAALRAGDLAGAEALLAKARHLGGQRADVWAVSAVLADAKGKAEQARADLLKAAALDPKDLESRWRFVRAADLVIPASPPLAEARKKALVEIISSSSANLPARLRLLLVQLEGGDAAEAKKNLLELGKLLADADARTRQFLGEASAALDKGDLKAASLKARIVENLLRVTPRYQQSLGEVFTNITGLPLVSFTQRLEAALRPKEGAAIHMALKPSSLAAPDISVLLRKVDLKNTGTPELYAIPAPYREATFFDYDMDGDLDVYVSNAAQPDRLLRNNLDGTFTDVTAATGEPEFRSVRSVAGDFDRDGDLDLVAIDAKGELVLRSNLRQGRFRTISLGVAHATDVAAEDLNADGALDLAVATAEGVVVLLNKGDGTFTREASGDLARAASLKPHAVLLADLDNDGFPDLVVAGASGLACFRRTSVGFVAWPIAPHDAPGAERMAALDVNNDGALDVVLTRGGKTSVLVNEGGNANGWLIVVVEGLQTGSGKVNKAGVGSLVEVKAGDLYVARTVGLLPTHIGLGPRVKADVVRCVFTNGIPQNLFDQRAKTVVKEVQQLKGSCPFVYACDGTTGEWSFVSDALGRAPLGLLFDGVHLAGADTREWLVVDGNLLRPTSGGELLIDYTEELWEVCFLDEATLLAVDHPEGTAIVPNERMVPGVLPKKLFTVANPRPPRAAHSTVEGKTTDVLDRISRRDHVYVDPGPETHYQGVRDEHDLVLDLGPIAANDRVVLFLDGWIFYTDTSINVSISQRGDLKPLAPVLEVPDGKGGWKVAIPSLGFPAGKTKTMPVELTGLLDPADPRVRIRTTMAIFWDQAFLTVNDPEVPLVTTSLAPEKAVLSERGFSRRYRRTPDGPELFAHDDVSKGPAWEDVPGLVTRLGDVTELLSKTDDRWVAFRGGDAIRIAYDARKLPPLPTGWRRDYVLVSDGWDKDFDKNTITGQSVEPWPFHAMSSYPYPPTESHPDPAFLREWLTRRVGPEAFQKAVREAKGAARW